MICIPQPLKRGSLSFDPDVLMENLPDGIMLCGTVTKSGKVLFHEPKPVPALQFENVKQVPKLVN